MKNLKSATLSGIAWVLVASGSQKVLGIATTIVLARLLSPGDFGLFALAFVLIDGFGLFKSLGVDLALIRQQERVDEAADTAFCLLPFIGLSLSALLYVAAPWAAVLLRHPEVAPLVRALSAIFVFSCLAQVPNILMQKRLWFWKRGLAETVATISYAAAAIGLAVAGCGVWSLVYAYLLKTAVHLAMVWSFAGWRPRLQFRWELAVQMLRYGKYILGGSLLMFVKNNVDNVIVGALLGTTALGYYALAFNLSTFTSAHVTGRMFGVLFPAFSQLQDDDAALCRAFLKALKLIALISVPFGLALVVLAPMVLQTIYGSQWLAASEVLRLLAVGGMLKALGGSQSPVLLAKGRARVDFWVNVAHVGSFLVFIVPLTRLWGLRGAGYVVLLSGGVSFLVGMWRVRRVLPVSWSAIATAMRPALIGSVLMLAVFEGLTLWRQGFTAWPSTLSIPGFLTMAAVSVIAYVGVVVLIDREIRLEVQRIV
ncbi:MAG: lipopolysaccharide biosynthesis protein [Candidatus Omnitrophica bacterium]|nr:lipopolysaccharide biosynthesis protein [Candidatus Omnitrophota bacterium]